MNTPKQPNPMPTNQTNPTKPTNQTNPTNLTNTFYKNLNMISKFFKSLLDNIGAFLYFIINYVYDKLNSLNIYLSEKLVELSEWMITKLPKLLFGIFKQVQI